MQGEIAAAGSEIAPFSSGEVRPDRAAWVALALILIYFIAVALLTPHAPFADDAAIEHDARAFGAAHSAGAAWQVLAAQHNEHRPALVRLVFWAGQALPEAARYPAIAMVGGLFLALLYGLMAREARRLAAPAAMAVVLAALMFNLGSAEASLWPTAAVANFGVLAMMALSLRMLSLAGWPAWAAILPALAAMGLQGNGLLVLVVGCCFLMCIGRYVLAFLWLFAAAAASTWYFAGYVRTIGSLDAGHWFVRGGEIISYVLAFCGSAIAFGGPQLGALNLAFVTVAALVGGALVAATLYGAMRGGLTRGRIELWINLFIIVSGLCAALSRLDHGVQQALTSRYHLNSCLMIASTLMYYLGEPGTRETLVRRAAPTLAVLGIAYVVAMAPIGWWVHRQHGGEPPADVPREQRPDDPNWRLDQASLSLPALRRA